MADAPNYSFNDYIQTGVETGTVGLMFFIGILALSVYRLIKARHPFGYGLIALMIFACFSYPFSIPAFQTSAILFVATGAVVCERRKPQSGVQTVSLPIKYITISLYLCLFASCVYLTSIYTKKIKATETWSLKSLLYRAKYYDQVVIDYTELYPFLKDQADFLLEYAHALHQTKQYERSNEILSQGVLLSSDPVSYNLMGENFKGLQDYDTAEACYQYAFDMIPNRLTPLYLLMKLYADMGQHDMALKMAQTVMDFIPKVDSHTTENMKREAQYLLQSQSTSHM